MTTAELIVWLERYMYLNSASASKAAAHEAARRIVDQLIDKGVLITSDATPSIEPPDVPSGGPD